MSDDPKLRDYLAWHDHYAQPGSDLHRRLEVVVEQLGFALEAAPSGAVRVLSLCAGQGHDVAAVASTHSRGGDLVGRLVELDPRNVRAARRRLEDVGVSGIEVVEADAGNTACCVGAVPADLVLACGIFGNISMADIERTVAALPGLCGRGASVVWTRHPRELGVVERIAAIVREAGFESDALVIDDAQRYAVGRAHLVTDPAPFEASQHLFAFTQ